MTEPQQKGPSVAGILVKTKDLTLALDAKELEGYRASQLFMDKGVLNRLMGQEAQERVRHPKFGLAWEDLNPGERARLLGLAIMSDEKSLNDDERKFLNRLVPEEIPMQGPRLEELFRGLRGTGLVGQEEAVRVYLERIKKGI